MALSRWEEVKEKLTLIEAWCRDGYTDEDIYNKLGISKDTFYRYKKEHTDLSDALKRGKEVVDVEVENELLKNAKGFIYKEQQAFKVKDFKLIDGEAKPIERIEIVEVERFKPGETVAQIFWLKNRKPKEWRDKQDIELSGDVVIDVKLTE